MEILNAIAHLKDACFNEPDLDGLSKPPDPPGSLNLPALVVYNAAGNLGSGSLDNDKWGVHTIVAEIHVKRSPSDLGYGQVMDFFPAMARTVLAAKANKFGGHVVMVGDEGDEAYRGIAYEIAQDDWNATATLALTFRITVTTQEDTIDG